MILKTYAYARAGLIGNPSDGYFGKTISVILKNFRAEVVLYESPELIIEPDEKDISTFPSIDALIDDVHRHGYYGGVRLIKAAIKKFGDYCREQKQTLEKKNFTIRYRSNIPRLVGMAGSSALVTATMRALQEFYQVDIPKPVLASLILSAENDELCITAGLQDRVIQVFEGMVYMNFDKKQMQQVGSGIYLPLDPKLLPPLYVAYDPDRSEVSGKAHGKLRALFEEGKQQIIETMGKIADLAEEAKELLLQGRGDDLGSLLDQNYDLRASIFPISAENAHMVSAARELGATAKFAGSGGTIIGTYREESMYKELEKELGAIGCNVFKPVIS